MKNLSLALLLLPAALPADFLAAGTAALPVTRAVAPAARFPLALAAPGAPALVAGCARPAQGTFGFAGTILNANSQRPIAADVVIYGVGAAPMGKLETSRTGTFTMQAPVAGVYRFAVSSVGYVPQELSVTAQAGAPVAFTVRLVPVNVGAKVTLNSIQFAQSKATLLPESFRELDRLADLLAANERLEIQLNGHTDNQGDAAKNVQLSEARVLAVQAYLTGKGVAAGRLRGQGFGGSQPIASNLREYTRKLNRRVEFEVLKN